MPTSTLATKMLTLGEEEEVDGQYLIVAMSSHRADFVLHPQFFGRVIKLVETRRVTRRIDQTH